MMVSRHSGSPPIRECAQNWYVVIEDRVAFRANPVKAAA